MKESSPPQTTPAPQIYAKGEHPISRRLIDPEALKIMFRLAQNGFKGYLVGGGVRDLFLGKTPKDVDLATDATPREIKSLFRNSRIIGKRYKLVHIFFHGGKIVEVSTFRDLGVPIDPNMVIESNAPIITRENTYGTEATDAIRRDITINGLFYDPTSGSIIDYVGGVQDLLSRTVRVIGEPAVRFAEDPVRMLRVARHAARNDFTIEEGTRQAVLKHFHLIARASPVRVYDELKKDLTFGCSLKTFRIMAELKLLDPILPELLEKDGVLLSDVSEFSRCFSRIDTLAKAGTNIPISSVLALCILFIQGLSSTRKDIYSWFQNRAEIQAAAKHAFKYFAVSKKDRERIASSLILWHDLGPPPFEPDAIADLIRHPARDDAALLVRYLSDDEDAAELVKAIERAGDDRSRPRRTPGQGYKVQRFRRPNFRR